MGAVANLVLSDTRRRRQLVEASLAPEILIGMPHLTPFGLSETWLLKELAHRHWLMLGQSMGLDDADFRTPDGDEVYAAICASAFRNADLTGVCANDILTVRSTIAPVSRTRMASCHHLSVDGRSAGELELVSAFVHRIDGAGNGAIARVRLPGFEATNHHFTYSALAERSLQVRRRDPSTLLPSTDASDHLRFAFTPSLTQDFNGARLLYFANYQSVIDRANESWFGATPVVRHKETHYLGNIVAGEGIVVKLIDGPSRCLVIERENGKPIAYQFGCAEF